MEQRYSCRQDIIIKDISTTHLPRDCSPEVGGIIIKIMEKNIKTFYNEVVNQLQEVRRRTIEVSKMVDQMERYLEDVENANLLED